MEWIVGGGVLILIGIGGLLRSRTAVTAPVVTGGGGLDGAAAILGQMLMNSNGAIEGALQTTRP
jgi:hypothetical protein